MLRELQHHFLTGIFAPTETSQIWEAINPSHDLSVEQQLAIYRGSVFGTLIAVLNELYPVCRRLVGDRFFTAMSEVFIRQYPSRSPDLHEYGEAFAEFIEGFEPAASLPYLPDVARLEWIWNRIFFSADEEGLDLTALAQVPQEQWSNLIFHLPRNGVLLRSAYPIHRIWQVNQEEESEERVDLSEGEAKLLIWRQEYTMRLDVLTSGEWIILNAMQANQPFGLLCEGLAVAESEVDIVSTLPRLVQQGWIGSFQLKA